jgi:hypothetical protein
MRAAGNSCRRPCPKFGRPARVRNSGRMVVTHKAKTWCILRTLLVKSYESSERTHRTMRSTRKRAGPDDGLRDCLAALRAKIEIQRAELSQFCSELDPGPPHPVDRGAEQGPEEEPVTTVVPRTGTVPTNALFWYSIVVAGTGLVYFANPQGLSAVHRAASAQATTPLLLPAPSVRAHPADPLYGWPPPAFQNTTMSRAGHPAQVF